MLKAAEDDWWYVLSEVIDPYAFMAGGDRSRLDLIVKRKGSRAPLVVDLKFGTRAWDDHRLDQEVHAVAEKYAAPAAARLDRKVVAVVVNVPPDGDPQWSSHQVRGPAA